MGARDRSPRKQAAYTPAMPRRALVVVTTFERPGHLRRAFEAYRRQTSHDFSMIVADDGSGPETVALVEGFAKTAPFPVDHSWWEHDGYRRAAVLNRAVRRSQGEPLIVFTDGDCVPPATYVERHIAAHGPRTFHVAGGVFLDEATSAGLTPEDIAAGRHERLLTPEVLRPMKARARRTRLGTFLRRKRHPRSNGLNVAVDRSIYEAINGYDEAFVGWGHEDLDLRDRLMRLRPRPRVRVLWGHNDTIHLWHPPTPDRGESPNEAYYRSKRPARCVRGLVDESGQPSRG